MSLDDRSLREHLARRADAGSTNPDDLAESVIAALPSSGSTSRWRPFVRAGQALAVAAAVVVAIVAAQTLTSQRGVEPGPSAGATPESTQTTDYPAVRAMTGEELEAFLLPDPALRAGVVVVANVEVRAASPSCPVAQPSIPENCPTIAIVLPGRTLLGFGEVDPGLVGPFAFRVRDTGELELLGTVQAGPDRLSWSLSRVPRGTARTPWTRHGPEWQGLPCPGHRDSDGATGLPIGLANDGVDVRRWLRSGGVALAVGNDRPH